jgi:hypothetical protein
MKETNSSNSQSFHRLIRPTLAKKNLFIRKSQFHKETGCNEVSNSSTVHDMYGFFALDDNKRKRPDDSRAETKKT